MAKEVTSVLVDGDPATYEENNAWPITARFLSDLPTGWVGLDAGTGNGKYLPFPTDRPGDVWSIGVDRSLNLLKIARTAGESGVIREVVWGNILHNCWRTGLFDYAISIATIHHLATEERRIMAVKNLLEAVSKDHGRLLLYVWAIEQDEMSKRRIPTDGATCSTLGRDVTIPWVYKKKAQDSSDNKPQIYNRYYHMFAKGELSDLVRSAAHESGLEVGPIPMRGPLERRGVKIVQEGWERSNYYIELRCWHVS
ncbi:hypothetical protein AX17_001903 [Amanita inopinata Kibby_2008]|nr:hypothetical protein AX17_001903 [Amanita inopinata Kibby_2008]